MGALLCAFLAVAIGLSRIYEGVHHPTDILGGWLAGTATGLLIGMAVVQMVNSGKAAELERAVARKARPNADAAETAAEQSETEITK